jgi:CyaY protein
MAIETALEASGAEVESSRSGPLLTLEFDDDSKIIVNSQAATQELWVAARSGGFHYRLDGTRWLNTRDSSELFAALSRMVSQQAGTEVALRAP